MPIPQTPLTPGTLYQSDDPEVLQSNLDQLRNLADKSRLVFDEAALLAKLGEDFEPLAARCLPISPALKERVGVFLLSLDPPDTYAFDSAEDAKAPALPKKPSTKTTDEDAAGPVYKTAWEAAWDAAVSAKEEEIQL